MKYSSVLRTLTFATAVAGSSAAQAQDINYLPMMVALSSSPAASAPLPPTPSERLAQEMKGYNLSRAAACFKELGVEPASPSDAAARRINDCMDTKTIAEFRADPVRMRRNFADLIKARTNESADQLYDVENAREIAAHCEAKNRVTLGSIEQCALAKAFDLHQSHEAKFALGLFGIPAVVIGLGCAIANRRREEEPTLAQG